MELNDYSRRFMQILLAAFPEWESYIVLPEVGKRNSFGGVLIKIPTPTQEPSLEGRDWLVIDTCDDEVIVSYDRYHNCFDSKDRFHLALESRPTEAESFEEAVEYLRQLVAEETCIFTTMNGEKWNGSGQVAPGKEPDYETWDYTTKTILVRSWLGTYDRFIKIRD